jgi:hypothetical protein
VGRWGGANLTIKKPLHYFSKQTVFSLQKAGKGERKASIMELHNFYQSFDGGDFNLDFLTKIAEESEDGKQAREIFNQSFHELKKTNHELGFSIDEALGTLLVNYENVFLAAGYILHKRFPQLINPEAAREVQTLEKRMAKEGILP